MISFWWPRRAGSHNNNNSSDFGNNTSYFYLLPAKYHISSLHLFIHLTLIPYHEVATTFLELGKLRQERGQIICPRLLI